MSPALLSRPRCLSRRARRSSSQPMASRRSSMAAGDSRGRARRDASIRAPGAVTVRSITDSSEPSRPPFRVRSISRLARVAGSMAMTSASPARRGGRSAGSLPAWVVSRCAAIRPSAEISAPARTPKPSRVSTP